LPGVWSSLRASERDGGSEDDVAEDYDPWQRFNEPMFTFNHSVLDRMGREARCDGMGTRRFPDPVQRCLGPRLDNLESPAAW